MLQPVLKSNQLNIAWATKLKINLIDSSCCCSSCCSSCCCCCCFQSIFSTIFVSLPRAKRGTKQSFNSDRDCINYWIALSIYLSIADIFSWQCGNHSLYIILHLNYGRRSSSHRGWLQCQNTSDGRKCQTIYKGLISVRIYVGLYEYVWNLKIGRVGSLRI